MKRPPLLIDNRSSCWVLKGDFPIFQVFGLSPSPTRFYNFCEKIVLSPSSYTHDLAFVKKLYAISGLFVKPKYLLYSLILIRSHPIHIQADGPNHHYLINRAELQSAF